MLGKDKNTLGSYERGQTVPDQDFLRAFARATGSSFDELNSVLDASVRVASGSWSDSVIGVEKYVADFTRRHLQLAAEHAGFSLADDPDFEVLRERAARRSPHRKRPRCSSTTIADGLRRSDRNAL
jgi:transcriptional regulator with XRE-family HTH domain